ncbi:hypothetical protein [Kordiimonas sp.]|uniref:phosphoribosyltransferase-like protein n=1 Tax=Kordiimonas sp. TaxID=1970157 RepID=UPI003A916396
MTVERLPHHIPKDTFESLFRLSVDHPWLIRKSSALFDLISTCEKDEEIDLVVKLISRINFFTPNDQLCARRKVCEYLTNHLGLIESDTLLIAIKDNELADSSSAYVQQMKGALAEVGGWRTSNFVDSLTSAVERVSPDGSLVIVDDFCGSGGAIKRKLEWLRLKLREHEKECRMFVAVAAAMEFSKKEVSPLAEDYYAATWLKRGISDNFSGPELEEATAAMLKLEQSLKARSDGKKLSDYSFGWRKSEALYYSEGDNPPNNNFPLFWWRHMKGGLERDPLIPRI